MSGYHDEGWGSTYRKEEPNNRLYILYRLEDKQMHVMILKDFDQFSQEKMKKHNVFQTSRFFCDVYCFEAGQEQKGHVHQDQDKVYLVLEGEGTFRIGNEDRVLVAGQGTMAAAGEPHGVLNHTKERLRLLVFMAPNPN